MAYGTGTYGGATSAAPSAPPAAAPPRPQPYTYVATTRLSAYLTDLAGGRLAQFTDRSGLEAELNLDGRRFAKLAVSIEDEGAQLVEPLSTLLKVYLDDAPEPIFAGTVLKPRYLGDRTVEIAAVGPHYRLEHLFTGQRDADGPDTGVPFPRQDQIDQAEIIFRLMEHGLPSAAETNAGIPGHAIVRGLRPLLPKPRNREYESGKALWGLIEDFENIFGGVDLQLQPVADSLASITRQWRLDVYDQLGEDKSERILFEYGFASDNCLDFTVDDAGEETINRETAVGQSIDGQPARTFTSNQLESQIGVGIYADTQGRSDVSDIATLAEHARGLVSLSAFPPGYFEPKPAIEGATYGYGASGRIDVVGIPPRCHPTDPDGYWLGDTVGAYYSPIPALYRHLTGRVTKLVLREVDSAGNVQVDPTCAPTATVAGVT